MMFDANSSKAVIPTPIGDVLTLFSEKGLRGCWFMNQSHFPKKELDEFGSDPTIGTRFHQAMKFQLGSYFNNQIDKFDIQLDLSNAGTSFQLDVWLALLNIPYGQTLSYSDIARKINRPNSTRAVGAAIGKNPISVIIPCHRVIGANGHLTGYAGGIERKRYLLNLEAAHLASPQQ